jgi:2-polyprenyl-6-methoxyphenol hydroxylase-like FAD-dependent oxidoreductase
MTSAAHQAAAPAILIIGAGPTGLALAAQLASFGIPFRIIDRALDRARESRALGVQARTLELLQSVGLADPLVQRGNPSARLILHFSTERRAEVRLGGFAASDTRFPFILFVSQAETEAVFGTHLTSRGVTVERGVELIDVTMDNDGVNAVFRHANGVEERVHAQYIVGCDGAHSTVRKRASIPFHGGAYLQDFMLGDVEADARPGSTLEPGTLHSFAGASGTAMFFPLGHPATWRVIAMSGTAAGRWRTTAGPEEEQPIASDLPLGELQAVVNGATDGAVELRDPVWLTHFRLHHRQAARYRRGPAFLAGDAGHIHSPVGAQGMNTGIQDAWNLGWKLALVVSGVADPALLDSYEAERWPVGRSLLRYTDRVFTIFTRSMSNSVMAAWVRRTVVARVLPGVMRSDWLRTFAFRFVSNFSIRYRNSPAVTEGTPSLGGGPRAGDRLPDARLTVNGRATTLQREIIGPRVHLLLCGRLEEWRTQASALAVLTVRYPGTIAVRHLTRSAAPDALVDGTGEGFARLAIRDTGQYLVRPDGYVAYRCAGTSLRGVERFLARWFRIQPITSTSDRRTGGRRHHSEGRHSDASGGAGMGLVSLRFLTTYARLRHRAIRSRCPTGPTPMTATGSVSMAMHSSPWSCVVVGGLSMMSGPVQR